MVSTFSEEEGLGDGDGTYTIDQARPRQRNTGDRRGVHQLWVLACYVLEIMESISIFTRSLLKIHTDENGEFCPLRFTLRFRKFGEQFLNVGFEL